MLLLRSQDLEGDYDAQPTWDSVLAKHLVTWAVQTWKGHKTHAQPTETEPGLCLRVSCGGTGQQWPAAGEGILGAADLGMA